MRDRRTVADANHKSAPFFRYLHKRLVIKVADVAQDRFDKDHWRLGGQAVTLANRLFLRVQGLQPGPVWDQHRELQVFEAFPEELGLCILEFKAAETELRAADCA